MYDLIVLGGGAAGLTAALYGARYNLNLMVITKNTGGAILDAYKVENFPCFKEISGMDWSKKFEGHVKSLGVEIKIGQVKQVVKENGIFIINKRYKAKSIIIALGSKRRHLNVPGEDKLISKGVHYCATCDAFFYKGKVVGVVGGNNGAAMAAELLASVAKKVFIIYRKEKLRCEPFVLKRIEKNPKIEIIYKTNVVEMIGKGKLKKVKLDSGDEIELDGVFIEIGSIPTTSLAKELGVEVDKEGLIKVDEHQKTNIEGAYAAGDITTGTAKWNQLITSCAEGGIAAWQIYEENKKG